MNFCSISGHYPESPAKFGELLLRIPELQRTCQVRKVTLSFSKDSRKHKSFETLLEDPERSFERVFEGLKVSKAFTSFSCFETRKKLFLMFSNLLTFKISSIHFRLARKC